MFPLLVMIILATEMLSSIMSRFIGGVRNRVSDKWVYCPRKSCRNRLRICDAEANSLTNAGFGLEKVINIKTGVRLNCQAGW